MSGGHRKLRGHHLQDLFREDEAICERLETMFSSHIRVHRRESVIDRDYQVTGYSRRHAQPLHSHNRISSGRLLFCLQRAAVSLWHLTMKFPTSGGIGCTRGDQREARECYNASISKARRGASSHMAAHTGASKGPHGEGAMKSHDREENMAPTIVHHHMEPNLGGDSAPVKAEI